MTTDINQELQPAETTENAVKLSYKFQRLRERLRQAIETGEITGKLPGERLLAKRFKVNAKTLSKALTDLAGEGLLDRSIGLGTFVRGATVAKSSHKCLILHDANDAFADVASMMTCDDLELQTHDHQLDLPPSLLTPHRSVIVLSASVTDKTLRDLVVRGKTVITVERRVKPYVTHAVLLDRAGDLADMARAMIRGGHKKLMIVGEPIGDSSADVATDIRAALPVEQATIVTGGLGDVLAGVADGVTGLLCTTGETARHAIETCTSFGYAVPQQVSVAAVGRVSETPPCSGKFTSAERIADAIGQLLRHASPHRPITLWLAGEPADTGSIAARPV